MAANILGGGRVLQELPFEGQSHYSQTFVRHQPPSPISPVPAPGASPSVGGPFVGLQRRRGRVYLAHLAQEASASSSFMRTGKVSRPLPCEQLRQSLARRVMRACERI